MYVYIYFFMLSPQVFSHVPMLCPLLIILASLLGMSSPAEAERSLTAEAVARWLAWPVAERMPALWPRSCATACPVLTSQQ